MPAKHTQSNKARKRCKPDLDEIVNDMHNDKKVMRLIDQAVDVEETGSAQHYCMPCRKYFESAHALAGHEKAKPHKRQLKMLKDTPYTQKEADAAAGLGDYRPFLPANLKDTNVAVIKSTLQKQKNVRENRRLNQLIKAQEAEEMKPVVDEVKAPVDVKD